MKINSIMEKKIINYESYFILYYIKRKKNYIFEFFFYSICLILQSFNYSTIQLFNYDSNTHSIPNTAPLPVSIYFPSSFYLFLLFHYFYYRKSHYSYHPIISNIIFSIESIFYYYSSKQILNNFILSFDNRSQTG
jgi:hypothetical protein